MSLRQKICGVFLSLSLLTVAGGAVGAEAIRVAVNTSLSGDAAQVNSLALIAAQFAAREINANGGVLGRPLEIIGTDNRSTPLGAKAAAGQAIAQQVVAVIGCMRSSHSIAAAPVLQAAQIPMISPQSTNPEVTQIGDYIFRVCYHDHFQGQLLADFAFHELGARRAAVLVNTNRVFSTDLGAIFQQRFEKHGGQLVYGGEFLDGSVDFAQHLTGLAKAQPDVVFLPSEVQEAGFIMRQAYNNGIRTSYLGPDSWREEILTIAGPAAEGAFFSTHWARDSEHDASKVFVEAWEQEHSQLAASGVALSFDAVHVLAAALERAGTATDSNALRDQLAASDYSGVTGPIRFDKQGDPIGKSAVIKTFKDGRMVYHSTVHSSDAD